MVERADQEGVRSRWLARIAKPLDSYLDLLEGARFEVFALDYILHDERAGRCTVLHVHIILVDDHSIYCNYNSLDDIIIWIRCDLRRVDDQNTAIFLNLMLRSKFDVELRLHSRPRILRGDRGVSSVNRVWNTCSYSNLVVFNVDRLLLFVNYVNFE